MRNPIIKRSGQIAGVLAVAFAVLAADGMPLLSSSSPRVLRKEVVVRASIEAVWEAWTTAEGLKFASKKSNVELRVGGAYEWFMDGPPDERGRRGCEGCRILEFQPHRKLVFDWTFPPTIPALRYGDAKTRVTILFEEVGEGTVRVRFAQDRWGEGEDWDVGYAYFDEAWDWVLGRLKTQFEDQAQTPLG